MGRALTRARRSPVRPLVCFFLAGFQRVFLFFCNRLFHCKWPLVPSFFFVTLPLTFSPLCRVAAEFGSLPLFLRPCRLRRPMGAQSRFPSPFFPLFWALVRHPFFLSLRRRRCSIFPSPSRFPSLCGTSRPGYPPASESDRGGVFPLAMGERVLKPFASSLFYRLTTSCLFPRLRAVPRLRPFLTLLFLICTLSC